MRHVRQHCVKTSYLTTTSHIWLLLSEKKGIRVICLSKLDTTNIESKSSSITQTKLQVVTLLLTCNLISHEIYYIFFHHSTSTILVIPSVMIYECCNLSPLQMLQNSFVLSALNAILLLCSLRQFMKNNAVAGMSTFLSKNRKLRLAYPKTTDSQ